ncbi:MAG: outer membrane protein [Gammaproteobacteria bacterium]|jgi:outer membrane protein insertion porin family|nr:outer membrane protein [Gammaproteobacteria bacterium]
MVNNIIKKCIALIFFSFVTISSFAEVFVVRNIQINGLQKIPTATVLEYIPVKPGQQLDGEDTVHIIQTLYQTGFFENVTLSRQGDTLIVAVKERPTIGAIQVNGNKQISKDDLLAALKGAGIAEGQIYSESTLEGMKQALVHQYNLLGRYNAQVNVTVTSELRNRVGIKIQISEGEIAKIKRINIIGNKAFTEKELQKNFKLSQRPWWALFGSSDEYSAEKLQEDLNALRLFYLDRGYLKFSVDSSQVTMTPDRKDIYASVRITEGDIYTVRGYRFSGNLLGKEKDLSQYITFTPGEVYSRQKVERIGSGIGRYFADMGYAGAAVSVEPIFTNGSTSVLLDFNVDPGDRIYVRNIEYSGNTKTGDEVLRRETRQMEGAVYSATDIDLSTRRLNNLGYVDNIKVEMVPVPGRPDQVDLNYSLKEVSSTTASAQVGYSDNYGILYGANMTQKNYKGTGKSVSLGFNNSEFSQVYSFSYFNPYYTQTMSRGYTLFYQKVTPGNTNISNYVLDTYGGVMNYRIPMSEYSYLTFGYGYEYMQVNTTTPSTEIASFLAQHGDHFNNVKGIAGWGYNNYDKAIFPTKGFNHYLGAEVGAPVLPDNLEYYRFNYDGTYYQPIAKGVIVALNVGLGYGNGYGSFDSLPFFKNFYAGGAGTVRGYEGNTLGPRDSNGNSIGGSVLAAGSVNLIIPNPISERLRTAVFFDAGNVFADSFDASDLRYSTGLQVDWFSPVGPLRFSLGKALNTQPGDRTQTFQFSVGTSI